MTKIAVIGLGYVGLPLAHALSACFPVIGFDVSKNRISELVKGFDRNLEFEFDDLTNIHYTDSLSDIRDCDTFIVTVPTPINSENKPDLSPLKSASTQISGLLKKGDLVIFESTVYPGCTEEVCIPILEQGSGLLLNDDFYCCYSPERINPGDKINTLTSVKKIISGSNVIALNKCSEIYSKIITAGLYEAPTIKVAEAAKVLENIQRDVNIALMNELSIVMRSMGIDTMDVISAASSKWNFANYRPGLVGGHCISVDPYYLIYKANENGISPNLISQSREINESMTEFIFEIIIEKFKRNNLLPSNSRIGVLGVTFKENCVDIRNSKIVDLIKKFDDSRIKCLISDPLADPNEFRSVYGLDLIKLEELSNLDCLIISCGHSEYRGLSCQKLKSLLKDDKSFILDLKSIISREESAQYNLEVIRI